MTDLPMHYPGEPVPTGNGARGRSCRRHVWGDVALLPNDDDQGHHLVVKCVRCGRVQAPALSKRGRSSRRLGQDGERRSERRYGWEKIGERGQITDLRGRLAKVQQKTSRGEAPVTWRGIFRELEAVNDGRTPLILFSFVRQGIAADDYVLLRGRDWLALHGRDEPEDAA